MWRPSPFRRLVWLVAVAFLIGAFYTGVRNGRPEIGGAIGASMAVALRTVERFVLRRNAGGLIPNCRFCHISACARLFMSL